MIQLNMPWEFGFPLKEDIEQIMAFQTLHPRPTVQKILVRKSLKMPAKFSIHSAFITLFKRLKNGFKQKNRFSFPLSRYIFKVLKLMIMEII